MAAPSDESDSSLTERRLHDTESNTELLSTADSITQMQKVLNTSDPYTLQEVKQIVERNSRALATEHERSKYFMDMIVQVLDMFKNLDKEKEKTDEGIAKLGEELRSRDITVQQLQGRISVQETEISRLEMQLSRMAMISYNGILFLEIKEYAQKKNAAKNGPSSFYSDEFYTKRHGYMMCSRIYLNGDGVGKGTHLSIFFAVKKGPYDNYLKWPFQQRVTFILVNQDGRDDLSDAFRPDATSSSFQKPTKEMNIASGCPMFVSHKVLENPRGGFIKSNTICLKVTVDPPEK